MKLFGIDTSIHWTYWIWAAFVMSGSILTLDYAGMLTKALLLVTLLVLVIGHELAHALTARKYGYHTYKIMMHVLGGVALINVNFDLIPPRQSFWIAAAGPAFNLVLGLPTLILFYLNPGQLFISSFEPELVTTLLGTGLLYFAVINLIMGIFNLIPAYPMDGGRIIRSLLSHLDRRVVVNVSNALSLFFAAGFIVFGIATISPFTALMGVILIMMVWSERKKVGFSI